METFYQNERVSGKKAVPANEKHQQADEHRSGPARHG